MELSPSELLSYCESEIISTAKLIMFTWTPKPLDGDQESLYDLHLIQLFNKWRYCMSTFAVCPELNLNGCIHYHGWYQMKDELKWYKQILPTMKGLGFFKPTEVKYRDSTWNEYYHKKVDDGFTPCFFEKTPAVFCHISGKYISFLTSKDNKDNIRAKAQSRKEALAELQEQYRKLEDTKLYKRLEEQNLRIKSDNSIIKKQNKLVMEFLQLKK